MAGIKEFSTADLNTVSRISSVSNTIEKINGVTVSAAPAFTGLLDTYGSATFAYSVRKLSTSATLSMRVRRDTGGTTGDDDEADVAFDTSLTDPCISLDSAISNASLGVNALTLGEFLNVGTVGGTSYVNRDSLTVTASCFVDALYDQSGNSFDSEQTSFSQQPQIHTGTVNTDLIQENGKPAFEFSGVTSGFVFINTTQITIGSYRTDFAVTSPGSVSTTMGIFTTDSASRGGTSTGRYAQNLRWNVGVISSISFDSGGAVVVINGSTTVSINTQHLTTGEYDGTNLSVYLDGTLDGTTSQASQRTGTSFVNVASSFALSSGVFTDGKMQEIIDYQIDRSGQRAAIESNINGFFSIYP